MLLRIMRILSLIAVYFALTTATLAQPPILVAAKWLANNEIAVIDKHEYKIYNPNFQLQDHFELIASNDPLVSIEEAQWSADEQRLAISVDFTTREEIQLWDIAAQQRLAIIRDDTPENFYLREFTWSPDGQMIAISGVRYKDSYEMVQFFDADTGVWVKDLLLGDADPLFMDWQLHDAILLSRFELEQWDLSVEPPVFERIIGETQGHSSAYSPAKDRIAYISMTLTNNRRGQLIEIRDVATLQLLQTLSHSNWVTSFRWQPAGLISVDADGITRVWEPDTGQLKSRFKTGSLASVELSPDGSQILTLSSDLDSLQIRDGSTGEILAKLTQIN